MKLTLEQQRNLHTTGYLLVVAVVLAVVYTMFSDGFDSFYPYTNALIIAPLMVCLIALFEFVVFTRNVRKRGFRIVLLLRILLYTVSIVLVILGSLIFTRMIRYDAHFIEIVQSSEFQDHLKYGDFKTLIAYICVLVILTNFTMQMSRKMGQGVLLGFILGRYRKPREVKRFLMFVKMLDARWLAEQMGNKQYLQFVNEILYDITDKILQRGGFIMEYVDSEMLVSWKIRDGQSMANCLRMFFEICGVATREKLYYYEKYGSIPSFAGALHFGTVVLGEVGEVKSEIVYTGDAVNTTHRLLQHATGPGQLVVSQEALTYLHVPSIFKVNDLGPMVLRGKQKPVGLKLVVEN